MKPLPRCLTAQDIAAMLACSKSKAYELMRTMPHIRFGALLRVECRDFDDYVRCRDIWTEGTRWALRGKGASGFVYFVEAVGTDRVKIGWTGVGVEARRRDLQTFSPYPLRTVVSVPGGKSQERDAHKRFEASRVMRGSEWFVRSESLDRFMAEVATFAGLHS